MGIQHITQLEIPKEILPEVIAGYRIPRSTLELRDGIERSRARAGSVDAAYAGTRPDATAGFPRSGHHRAAGGRANGDSSPADGSSARGRRVHPWTSPVSISSSSAILRGYRQAQGDRRNKRI